MSDSAILPRRTRSHILDSSLIFEISVLSVYDPLSAVTSGMDLTAHYCPQETFAILSCNKRNGSEREHLDHRMCKRSYLISRACVRWDTRIYRAVYIFVLENHPEIFKSQNHWDILSVTESFVDLQDSSAVSESRRRSHLSGFHQLSFDSLHMCFENSSTITTKEWVQNHNLIFIFSTDEREPHWLFTTIISLMRRFFTSKIYRQIYRLYVYFRHRIAPFVIEVSITDINHSSAPRT